MPWRRRRGAPTTASAPSSPDVVRPPVRKRLRRRYANDAYPLIALKFEDGHEIRLRKGEARSFDAYVGETIKIVVLWDPTSQEREVVAVKRAEEFDAGR